MPASANWPDSVMIRPILMVSWALAGVATAINAVAPSSAANDLRMTYPPRCWPLGLFEPTVKAGYRKVNLERRRSVAQLAPHRAAHGLRAAARLLSHRVVGPERPDVALGILAGVVAAAVVLRLRLPHDPRACGFGADRAGAGDAGLRRPRLHLQ